MNFSSLASPEVREIANKGSPALLNIVGRAFGLGQTEQRALVEGKLPTWLLIGTGVAIGFAAGLYVEHQWPGKVSKLTNSITGK